MPPRAFPLHPPQPFTIGILTARLDGPTEIDLWHGVADRALERNVNLIFFSGGIPHGLQPTETQKNILFNFAGQPNVDGLLIWANILSHSLDRAGLEAFCQRFTPLTIVSMGLFLPSFPSIRIDMYEGMQKLLCHLIEVHGKNRIAFIRGLETSQDAEERYQAYLETLDHYHLPIDPGLIVPGDFRRNSGAEAVKILIDSHKMDFDALVCANDNMAIGAMQALQAHGVRIPEDVIVVGFDDIEETRAITPSLTTVRTPWRTFGRKSIDLVLMELENEPLPEQMLLKTELICRQSCGCQKTSIQPHSLEIQELSVESALAAPSNLHRDVDTILSTLTALHWLDLGEARGLILNLLTDVTSTGNQASIFIQGLKDILSRIPSGSEIIEWQEVLSILRVETEHLFSSKDELIKAYQLLMEGYTLIGEMAHRKQLSESLEAVNQTNRLNHIVQTMATTYDIETLMELLALELPGLGIQSCFLSLYDEKGEDPAWSRLILAFVDNQSLPLPAGGLRFPTRQLVPQGLLPQGRCFAYDIEALFFQDEQIGFVLFEIGPRDGDIYTTLRGHLSSALKSAELVQVALEAEAKAIKSDQLKTQLLANVSHELRTPLNIILGLSNTALSSPNPYGIELPLQLEKDLDHIYDSGEHLIRIVNDLLDLSRAEIGELDLCFEPVSPLALLKDVFESFEESTRDKGKVQLSLDVPEHLPVLHADPVRLRQIFMNLLSNAFKFTASGRVVLGAEVQLPHIHFWVSDTGSGISFELQEKIFEPFVKAGSPAQHRSGIGLGLSITRRLVTLHGGSITLDSIPDAGSTFHVYIPLPGLNYASAKEVKPDETQSLLLWLSSNKALAAPIENICQKNNLVSFWLDNLESLDQIFRQGKPAALAWDLENARPGDWAIVQKLRSHPQYCQLPLLIFHENILDKLSGSGRLTNILLKPAGTQMIQHILNLLPQAMQHGEIWIIDDDPLTLKYYQDLIGSSLSDFLIRPIRGGEEALGLLEEGTPDLVLLDLLMPGVDGFQVLEHLRKNVKTAQIPVIIITGKILSYEDVRRLDAPRVMLQTKGVLSDAESLVEIQRVLTANSKLPQPTAMLVKQALAYFQQNYTRSFSMEELSQTIGVSKSYLSRIFKLDMGISPWDYLNRFRIQKAKEILLLTEDSITKISGEVGYEDVGYFGRVFHEIVGCSPRAYRQRSQASRSV